MVYSYTENDVLKIREMIKNGISVDDDGCEIWNACTRISILCDDNVKRMITLHKFVWTQSNGAYNHRQKQVLKTC